MNTDVELAKPTSPHEVVWPQPMEAAAIWTPRDSLPEPLAIRRLILPLDGSLHAERAVGYAASFASATRASIVLAHVRTFTSTTGVDAPIQCTDTSTENPHDVWDFQTYLAWQRMSLVAYAPEVEICQLDDSTVTHGLLRIESADGGDVVVITSHARHGAGRWLLGSLADNLVRQSPFPVLVIPPKAPVVITKLPHITRVVVPLDGSVLAEQALAPVLGWLGEDPPSELAPRDLLLLAVVEDEQSLIHAQRYVNQIRDRLAPHLPAVAISALGTVGDPGSIIVERAGVSEPDVPGDRRHADLIVMATHGRSGLMRYVYGSVATHVVAHAMTPVLLVHPAYEGM